MEFYVFDLELNRLGVIDDYTNVKVNPSYDSLGSLNMTIEGSKDILNLLKVDRIITKSIDITKGYIIKTRELLDGISSELQIIAPSLNVILNDRTILEQQEFTGTVEEVMKSFVNVNAINPKNPNRIIPRLELADNKGLGGEITESVVNKPLCDYFYELSKKYDVSFDILLDHDNKKFMFDVWQGTDRSAEQQVNPHVIFAKEFDNVLVQNYVENIADEKTTAIVLGEALEDQTRPAVMVNDEISGFERKEIIIEANILRQYTDENGQEVILSDEEYRERLEETGKISLSEYTPIRTYESEVDPLANFTYGVDYFMGDKVSIRNDDLGVILHTRIMSVVETSNKQGTTLQLNFGSNIPSLKDKLKRAVK